MTQYPETPPNGMLDWRQAEETLARLKSEHVQLTQALADHKNSLRIARRRLHGESFLKELESHKEYIEATSHDPRFAELPTRGMTYKLRTYEHIASHGYAIPQIYRTWDSPTDMDLDDLPDSFVVKSDGGSTSKGVLPLIRQRDGRFLVADGSRSLTSDEVKAHFEKARSAGEAYGAMFAEALLRPRDGSDRIPDDVKVYTAYGSILQVLLRQVDEHGVVSETRSKYVDEHGADLGQVASHRQLDPSIPVPDTLGEMIAISRHLSRASGLPFVRIDLYDTEKGIVVGEITRAPGGAQTYTETHDQQMGRLWHLARAELQIDVQKGRPAGLIWGDREIPKLYSGLSPSLSRDRERRTVVSCDSWCTT